MPELQLALVVVTFLLAIATLWMAHERPEGTSG